MSCKQDGYVPAQSSTAPCKSMEICAPVEGAGHRGPKAVPRAPPSSTARSTNQGNGHTIPKVPAPVRGRSATTITDCRVSSSFPGFHPHAELQIAPAKIKDSPWLPKGLPKPRKSRGTKCTSDQKPNVEQGIPSSTSPSKRSDSKDFAQCAKKLCKDCKASNLESICYIANDGRIAAAKLTGPCACHSRHCNTPRCAANQNCRPSSEYPASQRPTPRTKAKLRAKDRLGVKCSSGLFHLQVKSIGGDGDIKDCADTRDSTENHWPAEELRTFAYGTSTADSRFSATRYDLSSDYDQSGCIVPGSLQNCISSHHQNHNISCSGEDPQASERSPLILGQSKCLFYNADNELSSSEDGADLINATEFSESLNAFSTGEHQTRSRVARMRRKYLDALQVEEAETVRLRKQEIQARKNAEDWMVDCAMEDVLRQLAPNGEACVKVLVEAFEAIIHHSDSDRNDSAAKEPEHPNRVVPMHC